MKHKFESTDGYPDECVICCGKHAIDDMIRRPQVYRRMPILPLYCEPEVSISDMQDSYAVLEHIVMFGGNK